MHTSICMVITVLELVSFSYRKISSHRGKNIHQEKRILKRWGSSVRIFSKFSNDMRPFDAICTKTFDFPPSSGPLLRTMSSSFVVKFSLTRIHKFLPIKGTFWWTSRKLYRTRHQGRNPPQTKEKGRELHTYTHMV